MDSDAVESTGRKKQKAGRDGVPSGFCFGAPGPVRNRLPKHLATNRSDATESSTRQARIQCPRERRRGADAGPQRIGPDAGACSPRPRSCCWNAITVQSPMMRLPASSSPSPASSPLEHLLPRPRQRSPGLHHRRSPGVTPTGPAGSRLPSVNHREALGNGQTRRSPARSRHTPATAAQGGSRTGSVVGDSGFGNSPGPITFTANNANDLNRTNVGTKRDERWPDGPERTGRRSNVLSGVPNFGVLGEQSEGAVKRFQHSLREIEAKPLRYAVPDVVPVGLGGVG